MARTPLVAFSQHTLTLIRWALRTTAATLRVKSLRVIEERKVLGWEVELLRQ